MSSSPEASLQGGPGHRGKGPGHLGMKPLHQQRRWELMGSWPGAQKAWWLDPSC